MAAPTHFALADDAVHLGMGGMIAMDILGEPRMPCMNGQELARRMN